MWSFPSLNDVCKRYLDLALAEWKPAKLGAHGLLLELGRSPDERRARDAKRDGCPATAHREGRCHDQDAESHHVGPAHVAEEPLAMDHERETKPDHKQAAKTSDETVRIHRKSRSGGNSRSRVSAPRPSWPLPAQWPCRADSASTGHTWLPGFGRTPASSCACPCLTRRSWRYSSSASHRRVMPRMPVAAETSVLLADIAAHSMST